MVRWLGAKGSPGLCFAVFTLLGGLLFSWGCAGVTDSALDQDVAQLRQDVNVLKLSAQRGRGEAEAVAQLERRAREQSADNARQLTALSGRLETISAELSRVSARLDDVSRRLDTVSRRSSPAGPPAPPPGAPPTATPPLSMPAVPPPTATAPAPAPRTTPPAPAQQSAGSATAEETYQAAYLDFSRGRYPLAINGFRDFLRRFPDSSLADTAQYGIGESYYSLASAATAEGQSDKASRALEQAVQEFRKVTAIYPRGAKVPTALYKEALALAELKQTALAQARLQYLLDHFPQSEEASLAKERLATLPRR